MLMALPYSIPLYNYVNVCKFSFIPHAIYLYASSMLPYLMLKYL